MTANEFVDKINQITSLPHDVPHSRWRKRRAELTALFEQVKSETREQAFFEAATLKSS